MQKCIKSQICTIPIWPLENLLQTLEKKSPRNPQKSGFSKIDFDQNFEDRRPPLHGGSTVPIYGVG